MSDYIPIDVVNKILLKLPIKSLMRCRVVCQSWNNLIKSSAFVNTHLHMALLQLNSENDVNLLLLQSYTDDASSPVYSLNWNDPELSEYTNFVTPTYTIPVNLVGTCNGLVCLVSCFTTFGRIILWNPSVRKYVSSSIPLCCFNGNESYAFGYVSLHNDYKVLLLTEKKRDDHNQTKVPVGMVWSFASGTWTSFGPESLEKIDLLCPFADGLASVNSTLHWLQYDQSSEDDDINYNICVTSFDLVTETFKIDDTLMVKDALSALRITRYKQTLALFEFRTNENHQFCDLWVMKEYGKDIWTKIVTARHDFVLDPFGFKNSRELVIGLENEAGHLQLKSMNIDSKEMKQFGRDGHAYYFMDSFVETLVLLDHPNAMSYFF